MPSRIAISSKLSQFGRPSKRLSIIQHLTVAGSRSLLRKTNTCCYWETVGRAPQEFPSQQHLRNGCSSSTGVQLHLPRNRPYRRSSGCSQEQRCFAGSTASRTRCSSCAKLSQAPPHISAKDAYSTFDYSRPFLRAKNSVGRCWQCELVSDKLQLALQVVRLLGYARDARVVLFRSIARTTNAWPLSDDMAATPADLTTCPHPQGRNRDCRRHRCCQHITNVRSRLRRLHKPRTRGVYKVKSVSSIASG